MYKYFKRVRSQYKNKVFGNIISCLAQAFKLCVKTIKRIVGEKSESDKESDNYRIIIVQTNYNSQSGSKMQKQLKQPKFDAFDKCVIRQVVQVVQVEFYEEKEMPTLELIKNRLRTERNLKIGIQKLRFLLYELGFKWKK